MTKKYFQLTLEQRYQIEALKNAGHNQTAIAKIIGFNKSTVCHEFKRNIPLRGTGAKVYAADKAHKKTDLRHQEKYKSISFSIEMKQDARQMMMVKKYSPELVCAQTMDDLIESYGKLGKRLLFISDGATWIKNWIEDAFPNAISILDYYHACEHLHEFSNSFFKDKEVEQKWTTQQKELLLKSQVLKVIKNIKALANGDNREAEKLITYYQSNSGRMDYQKYKQIGCGIIGSGAIESAHRTLIQKRMKLSGQR